MCGIAGWAGGADPAIAARMLRRLAHRGPDGEGSWQDEAAGLWLGQRRLAIIDLSEAGAQPMLSASGRYAITYNGEIYNHPELRAGLAARGARFRGTSDTETLLALIEEAGLAAAVPRLNGMFAFALWDRQERRLSLVRDRVGIKPLAYCEGPDGQIAFASEITALACLPWFDATLDPAAVADYFRYLATPAPASIFRAVRKLPPGAILHWQDGRSEITRYWSVAGAIAEAAADPLPDDLPRAAEALAALLADAVRAQLISDVPIGAFLSGGIDSALVVAMMRKAGAVRSFTIGFPDPRHDESGPAEAVAAALGTAHQTIRMDETEAMRLVPALGAMFDEPFADASSLPVALLCRAARAHVTVALAGDGGDELFGGYPRYFHGARVQRLRRRLGPAGSRIAARALRAVPHGLGDRLAPLLPGGGGSAGAGARLARLADYLDAAPSDTYREAIAAWRVPPLLDPAWRAAETGAVDLAPFAGLSWAGSMMALDQAAHLPDDLLTKTDRASMAVGLEVRVPLLDHRVLGFAWRLPERLKLGGASIAGKQVLRTVLARHLPRELFERSKMGFGAPLGRWLGGPLRDWAEAVLAPARLAGDGVLDVGAVREAWARFLATGEGFQRVWTAIAWLEWRAAWSAGAAAAARDAP
ncbi:MAG: asparagine synthase (glutamine-hydrolyzing) [Alphaproteobacteria bacterium]|nr:asparagine synthase (glutamine-hydrolyzing) [Alphaproteobacteria bacterium]